MAGGIQELDRGTREGPDPQVPPISAQGPSDSPLEQSPPRGLTLLCGVQRARLAGGGVLRLLSCDQTGLEQVPCGWEAPQFHFRPFAPLGSGPSLGDQF